MILISQNKERILWFGRAFNALEYKESVKRKEKEEEIRHTICISDGTLEEVAAYESKERCLEVLKEFCRVYENECYTVASMLCFNFRKSKRRTYADLLN